MGRFLRDNWVWIIAPIVVVLVLICLIWYFTDDAGVTPFQYQSF